MQAAAPVCSFPGCTKAVFVEPTTNRVHDYCGRTHATAHGALKAQPQAKTTTGVSTPSSSFATKVCGLPGCNKAVYVEPGTGKVHDYCGRTHAQKHLAASSTSSSPTGALPSSSSSVTPTTQGATPSSTTS
ncbi:TRUD domain-containing protein [Balamuthia mandrillaris]